MFYHCLTQTQTQLLLLLLLLSYNGCALSANLTVYNFRSHKLQASMPF